MTHLGPGLWVGHNGAGSKRFDPITVLGANLLGYMDAERTESLSLSGSAVTNWTDLKSGGVFTQPVSSQKPIYDPAAFNNRPGLIFDGVDDQLEWMSCTYPTASDPCEIWILGDQQSPSSDVTQRTPFQYGDFGTALSRLAGQCIVVTGVNRSRAVVGDGTTSFAVQDTFIDYSGKHLTRTQISSTATSQNVDSASVLSTAVVPGTSTLKRSRIGSLTTSTGSNRWLGVINCILVTLPLTQPQVDYLNAALKSRGGIS